MLSLWRGAIFSKNGMTRPGAQNGAQNDPQIDPQTTPIGLQIAKKIPPNRRLVFSQIQAPFLRFWGVQNDPKKHPKTAFGAQGSLGGLQGTLWGAFGVHFGLILKLSGAKFRALLVNAGLIFELCLQAPRPPALITTRT